jgi:hypothetical protein
VRLDGGSSADVVGTAAEDQHQARLERPEVQR